MMAILTALAEPLATAFITAFGQALANMLATWERDRLVSGLATTQQALAASEAARAMERDLAVVAATPIGQNELLDTLDKGEV